MFWTIVLWYVAFSLLVITPFFVKWIYETEKRGYYEVDGITPKHAKRKRAYPFDDYYETLSRRWTEEEIREKAWDMVIVFASILALAWPITAYYYGLKYVAKHGEYKADRERRAQVEQERALAQARAILEDHRKSRELEEKKDHATYDQLFNSMGEKVSEMESRERFGAPLVGSTRSES